MRSLVLAAALAVFSLSSALAGDPFPTITDPVVRKECSDCHMLYQPEMLSQVAWRKMLNRLSDHFGEDASLAPETAKLVLDYHLASAADVSSFKEAKRFLPRKGKAMPLKITDTPRYLHKHERILADVWKRKNIKSKANCKGCHLDSDKGDYDSIADNLMYKWVDK